MQKISLGQKVKCHSFIKKTGSWIQHISDNNLLFHNKKTDLAEPLEYEQDVLVNEIIKKEFEGFICGRKRVHQHIYASYCGEIDVGIGVIPEKTEFIKTNFIDCFEVCTENRNKTWGKKYVPVNDVEIIEEPGEEKHVDQKPR